MEVIRTTEATTPSSVVLRQSLAGQTKPAASPLVSVIPATQRKIESGGHIRKAQTNLRVTCYARISTDAESQQTSYETQRRVYTKLIAEHEGWVFAGLYAEMLTASLIQMHPTCTQTAP